MWTRFSMNCSWLTHGLIMRHKNPTGQLNSGFSEWQTDLRTCKSRGTAQWRVVRAQPHLHCMYISKCRVHLTIIISFPFYQDTTVNEKLRSSSPAPDVSWRATEGVLGCDWDSWACRVVEASSSELSSSVSEGSILTIRPVALVETSFVTVDTTGGAFPTQRETCKNLPSSAGFTNDDLSNS